MPNPQSSLTVGWDSEYDTSTGQYIPISTQMYILEEDRHIFIPHVGNAPITQSHIELLA